MNELTRRRLAVIVPIVVCVISLVIGVTVASSSDTYSWVISSLNAKQETALTLIAASTALAAATSALQSISNLMVSMTTGFAAVYGTIMFEKYLFVAMTKALFFLFIPAGCVLRLAYVFLGVEGLKTVSNKILLFGIAMFLAVPCSLVVSDLVVSTYSAAIDESALNGSSDGSDALSASTSADVVDTVAGSGDADSESASSAAIQVTPETALSDDFLGNMSDSISNVVTGAIDQAGQALTSVTEEVQEKLNNMVEMLALMVVTTCVIPFLVLLFFLWLVKIFLGVEIKLPRTGHFMSVGSKINGAVRKRNN